MMPIFKGVLSASALREAPDVAKARPASAPVRSRDRRSRLGRSASDMVSSAKFIAVHDKPKNNPKSGLFNHSIAVSPQLRPASITSS
jgi:hypothetical protein